LALVGRAAMGHPVPARERRECGHDHAREEAAFVAGGGGLVAWLAHAGGSRVDGVDADNARTGTPVDSPRPCPVPGQGRLQERPRAMTSRANSIVAVVPAPGVLSSRTGHWKRSPSLRTIDRPMPLPLGLARSAR